MATKVTIQNGQFQDAAGNAITGMLVLQLSQDALVSGTATVAPALPISIVVTAGQAAATPVWGNDNLTPSGTVYRAVLSDSSGAIVWGPENWSFTGAGPIELNTMIPTSTGVTYASPVLKVPGADQTIADHNLLPAVSNTTQSLGSSAAMWNGVFGVETVGKWNSVRVVDGVKFTTIAAAQADLPTTGGIVVLPPGYRETITTKIDLGSATKPVILFAYPDVILTVNVTDGTYLFNVHNGSGIIGSNVGSAPSRNGGFTIQLASTTNVASVIDTGEKNTAGGQAYILLENFFLQGHASATVSNAMVNIENVLGQARIKNIYVVIFANCYGVKCTTNVNATGTGPLVFDNVWIDGQANTGAKPVFISTNGSKTMLPIDWIGGVVNHPGAGCNSFEVDGNGIALGGCAGMRIHTYFEKLTGAAAISLRLRDVVGVDFSGCVFVLTDADTAIDISESAANRTAGIHGGPVFKSSPTNAATLLNNHITGEVISGAVQPFYNYGGESATSCAPFTISANDVSINDRSNHTQYSFPLTGNPVFRNFQDATLTFAIDSGSTATQNTLLMFRDRNTDEWSIGKDTGNNMSWRDRVNAKNHLVLTPTSGAPKVGFWRVAGNQGTALVTGDFVASAGWGTAPTLTMVGGTDQAASLTIQAKATTGANPTLTLTFKDGTWGTAPIVTCVRTDNAVAPTTAYWAVTSVSATQIVFTFVGTPTATNTYGLAFTCMGV
jgi:hypothetical protein